MATQRKKLSWFAPRWSFAGKLLRELPSLLTGNQLARLAILTALATAVILLICKWAVPRMVLPPLWQLVAPLPMILILLVVHFVTLTIIPPGVAVKRKGIVVAHGSNLFIPAAKIIRAKLTVHRDDRIRLHVIYTSRHGQRTKVIGVPSGVNLQELVALLPGRTVVDDARTRRIRVGGSAKERDLHGDDVMTAAARRQTPA